MREFPWLCSVTRKESGFLCNGVLEFILKPIRAGTVTYYITRPSQSSQKNVTRPLLLRQFSWMPASHSPSLSLGEPTCHAAAAATSSSFPKVFNLPAVSSSSALSNSLFITLQHGTVRCWQTDKSWWTAAFSPVPFVHLGLEIAWLFLGTKKKILQRHQNNLLKISITVLRCHPYICSRKDLSTLDI